MKKLNANVNRNKNTIYINLTQEDIKNLEINHIGQSTIMVNLDDYELKACNFASRFKDYLNRCL